MPTCRIQLAFILSLLAALASCAAHAPREPAPTLASLSPIEVLAILRLRAESLDTTASTGTMTLTSPTREQVTLDFAARTRQDHFRLRAWRFGEAVLDVTTTPEGAWMYVPPTGDAEGAGQPDDSHAAPDLPSPDDLARAWLLLSGRILERAIILEETADTLTLESELDGDPVQIRIDRAHLRPFEYRFPGAPDTSIELDPADWLNTSATTGRDTPAWPRRVTLLSPRGRIELQFNRAEVNLQHPASVFDPPARAKPFERTDKGR